jgi:hypothetical protein
MAGTENENTPILRTWRNVYALVILVEALVVVSLYFFTLYFK